jgi:hypothetical protein
MVSQHYYKLLLLTNFNDWHLGPLHCPVTAMFNYLKLYVVMIHNCSSSLLRHLLRA